MSELTKRIAARQQNEAKSKAAEVLRGVFARHQARTSGLQLDPAPGPSLVPTSATQPAT